MRKHAITPKPKAPAKKAEKEEIVSEASNTKKAIINKEKIEKAADTPGMCVKWIMVSLVCILKSVFRLTEVDA